VKGKKEEGKGGEVKESAGENTVKKKLTGKVKEERSNAESLRLKGSSYHQTKGEGHGSAGGQKERGASDPAKAWPFSKSSKERDQGVEKENQKGTAEKKSEAKEQKDQTH